MSRESRKRKSRSSKTSNSIPAFLLKTYEILENPVYQDICSWNKEGNAFIVKKITDFSEKVLPKFFKHNNFASFVRQLNMYDFHKTRTDSSENEFRHKMFKRGQKNLLSEIKRKATEGGTFTTQLVPYDKYFDMEKVRKECTNFTKDLSLLKTRQTELEKVSKVLYTQNNQLVKENKLLWNELNKSKDKYERKIEKLMMFIYNLMQSNGTPALSYIPKKEIEMDLPDLLSVVSEDPEDIKKETEAEQSAQFILDSQMKNEKKLKKLLKFFDNGDDSESFDALLNMKEQGNKKFNIKEEDSVPSTSEFAGTEHFEQPKKRKGRPRKLKAITDGEESKDLDLKKQIKTSVYGQPNMFQDDEGLTVSDILSQKSPLKLDRNPSIDINEFSEPLLKYKSSSIDDFENSIPIPLGSVKKEYNYPNENLLLTNMNGQSEQEHEAKILFSPGFFTPTNFITDSPRHIIHANEDEFY